MENETPGKDTQSEYRSAEVVFALAAFGFALFLISQAGSQVTWSSSRALTNQPGFWPVMAISGMVLFGAPELFLSWRRYVARKDGTVPGELLHWCHALEFVAWFLVYVLLVPQAGYLLSTIVFCVLLTLRLGYRSGKTIAAATLTGLAIVVIFKSFLSVKIPGGAIYEYLPATLRNFMIIYF